MDTKINLSQLAKALTLKRKMSQKDAEAFLREFFDAIIQNVTTDKLVKIKGLGTFKLIEVLDRESVNVSTGERFVIPGHTKLSFTPDASLKDMVNKPFADFQTVVINEGTSLEEMERIPQEEEESEQEPEFITVSESEPEIELEPEIESESEVEPEPELEPEPIPVPTPEPIQKSEIETRTEEVPVSKALAQQSQPEQSPRKHGFSIAKICACVAGIILLCLLSFYAGSKIKYEHGDLREAPEQQQSAKKSEAKENRQEKQESEGADSLQPVTTPMPETEQKEEIQYAQVPGGEYKITGTRKTYVMKPGDYLTKIAVDEYGDKEFTRYIITHNRFPDPNNVPVGAEIKLPELKKME